MRTLFFGLLMATIAHETIAAPPDKVILVIHGGAGVMPRNEMTKTHEAEIRRDLNAALKAGYDALQRPRATSLDGVEAAIRVMEDSPLFNAGKGAALTREKHAELDASIMDGRTLAAGAVACVTTLKNPISAARAVMEKSGHVLLVGPGADKFGKEQGLAIVDPAYFITPKRLQDIEQALSKQSNESSQESSRPTSPGTCSTLNVEPTLEQPHSPALPKDQRFGTVGAVALDATGNLAAGTSTGGMTMKRPGRVGDSPIIGAGTYADNASCAVSATGDGEYFIRTTAARSICALVEFKGLTIQQAADEVIRKKIKQLGGEGGVIVLNPRGEHAFSIHSEGMYRGYITASGKTRVMIYLEE